MRTIFRTTILRRALFSAACLVLPIGATLAAPPMLQADGSVHVGETDYAMPGSFSPEARKAFSDYFTRGAFLSQLDRQACLVVPPPARRECDSHDLHQSQERTHGNSS